MFDRPDRRTVISPTLAGISPSFLCIASKSNGKGRPTSINADKMHGSWLLWTCIVVLPSNIFGSLVDTVMTT